MKLQNLCPSMVAPAKDEDDNVHFEDEDHEPKEEAYAASKLIPSFWSLYIISAHTI